MTSDARLSGAPRRAARDTHNTASAAGQFALLEWETRLGHLTN